MIAVGPGVRDDQGRLHAPDVKAGDRVVFGKWSGSEIKIDGSDFLVMKKSDIIGVIEIRHRLIRILIIYTSRI